MAECTQAEAVRVAGRYAYDPSDPKLSLELCGAFLGPGSKAMVVVFGYPVCLPLQSWAVFGERSGAWQLVKHVGSYLVPPKPLRVVPGGGIRELALVHRRGDPRCLPTGGTRARVWRWNGSELVPGPWRQVTPGKSPPPPSPPASRTSGHFKTPSANIVCDWFVTPDPQPFIICGIHSGLKPPPPRRPCTEGGYAGDRINLFATGRPLVPDCAGDPGPFVAERSAPVLAYGRTWSGGGLRCSSAMSGLTCRNRSGHGFFLSRARYRTF